MAGQKAVQTPHTQHANLSVANTNLDGTGTLVECWTGVAGASACDNMFFKAKGDVTTGYIAIFRYNNVLYELVGQIFVSRVTQSADPKIIPTWSGNFQPGVTGRTIVATDKLFAAPYNAETFANVSTGGDF